MTCSPFQSPASRISSSSARSRFLTSPYMVRLPRHRAGRPLRASRVAARDVGQEILVERPLQIVGGPEAPVAAGAGVVHALRPRVHDGLPPPGRSEADPRPAEGRAATPASSPALGPK